jgi:hypothetical protein
MCNDTYVALGGGVCEAIAMVKNVSFCARRAGDSRRILPQILPFSGNFKLRLCGRLWFGVSDRAGMLVVKSLCGRSGFSLLYG